MIAISPRPALCLRTDVVSRGFALFVILTFCACAGGDGGEGSSSSSSSGVSSVGGGLSSAPDPAPGPFVLGNDNVGNFQRTISFCGTDEPDESTLGSLATLFQEFRDDFGLSRSSPLARAEVTIPVVFHVISKGPSFDEGEVPDAMLQEQIAVLNRAYSGETGGVPTPFRFSLEQINRVRNSEWHHMGLGSDAELAAKEALKVGGAETLNVYLVNTIEEGSDPSQGVILGYALLPVFYGLLGQYDGIVINFKTLPGGPIPHYNIGHVLVHEAGHWLGLFHTFQGECDGFFSDLVADTPREKTPERGQFCPVGRDSCPGEGGDPINNHMTYTGDECRTEFTPQQVEFMMVNSFAFRGMPVL